MNSRQIGKIDSCPKNGCNYHCCDFNQGNYIVLLPNEWDYIEKTGQSREHLHIIDTLDNNSYKVVCTAKDRKNCDKGYKPVDCQIYPLFPKGSKDYFVKGKKCPLSHSDLIDHQKNCTLILENLPFCSHRELKDWYAKTDLVGYDKFSKKSNDN